MQIEIPIVTLCIVCIVCRSEDSREQPAVESSGLRSTVRCGRFRAAPVQNNNRRRHQSQTLDARHRYRSACYFSN